MNKLWIRYRRFIFIFSLFLLPALALVLGHFPLPRLNLYDRLSAFVVHPTAEAADNLTGGMGYVWHRYIALTNVVDENNELTKINAELKAKILGLEESERENARLKKLLSVASSFPSRKITARIIGEDSTFESFSYVINAGSREGINLRQPVITADGIAGTITKVFSHSAIFQALIDPGHDVDGIIARSRSRFVVEGKGAKLTGRLKYLDRSDDVRVGDLVVSSGFDGVFPPGLQIGHVVSVRRPRMGVTQSAEVRPSVDFGQMEEVIVLEIESNDIRETDTPGDGNEPRAKKS